MNYRVAFPDEFEEELLKLRKTYSNTFGDDDIVPNDYEEKFDEYVFKHGSPELVKAYKQYLKDIEHDEDM